MKRIYLDNAATTQMYPEVVEAMEHWMKEEWGNPSSVYVPGRRAKRAIESARKTIADCIGANVDEIVFTSGGTESDNMAIKGVAFANQKQGKHIVTTNIEHPAVLNTCHWLEQMGWEVTYVQVQSNGIVDLADVNKAIREDTVLVSVMAANNEIGTIQPIGEISSLIKMRQKEYGHKIYLHVDAVQAMAESCIDVDIFGCDLLSMSAHKFHGPQGVGALYIRRGTTIDPIIHGGGQQSGMRSGTENVAGIVGMAKALEMVNMTPSVKYDDMARLTWATWAQIKQRIPNVHSNGSLVHRLGNNLNITIDGVEAETLLLRLDICGICCSAGSACSSNGAHISHVLKAIGLTDDEARSTLRITLSTETTEEEMNIFVDTLVDLVKEIREMSFSS